MRTVVLINRTLFRVITIFLISLSACTPLSNPSIITPTATILTNPPASKDFLGRVVDISGAPISGANVSTDTGSSLSDDLGWFHLASTGIPQWITVTKTGFIARTRAAEPGVPVLLRISPDDGKTIVINFGGDTMFGRRFFDPNEDGDPSDGLLPVHPNIQDHLKLLAPIRPLLESGDLTVVNLESAISDEPFFSSRDPRPTTFHPYKEFVYATSPSAIFALKQAGVDVVDTGNNHIYDMLDNGLTYTLSELDQANMAHFGSGLTEESAWAPKMVQVKGQSIAFIGCTTIWTPIPPVTANDISYVASDQQHKGGAARCNPDKLYREVMDAKQNANLVVVMIHGGFEYEPAPSENVVNLSLIAKSAGASLIINGHSHVTSGFVWDNQSLIGQSMGNFIFDQTIWPTFESYMLTVYIREGRIIRAFVEPLMIKDYIAHGVTGELADSVVREAAGRESGPFVVENGAMEVDINHTAKVSTKKVTLDGGTGTIVPIPQGQWLSGFQGPGSLLLGRDLLWIGGFENHVVGNEPGSLPLWEQDATSNVEVGAEYAYEGQVGIGLSRGSGHQAEAVTTHLHRILVKPGDQITVSGMVRESQGAVTNLQVSLYPDTLGPSNDQITEPLIVKAAGVWQPFHFDLQVPSDIVALGLFFKLSPPSTGISNADFDNIRVIKWAPAQTPFSALYNFAYLTGTGDLSFSQSVFPGGEDWIAISK
jgi:capsule synthesis protein PGA_cap